MESVDSSGQLPSELQKYDPKLVSESGEMPEGKRLIRVNHGKTSSTYVVSKKAFRSIQKKYGLKNSKASRISCIDFESDGNKLDLVGASFEDKGKASWASKSVKKVSKELKRKGANLEKGAENTVSSIGGALKKQRDSYLQRLENDAALSKERLQSMSPLGQKPPPSGTPPQLKLSSGSILGIVSELFDQPDIIAAISGLEDSVIQNAQESVNAMAINELSKLTNRVLEKDDHNQLLQQALGHFRLDPRLSGGKIPTNSDSPPAPHPHEGTGEGETVH